jgi:hypothetical protein
MNNETIKGQRVLADTVEVTEIQKAIQDVCVEMVKDSILP